MKSTPPDFDLRSSLRSRCHQSGIPGYHNDLRRGKQWRQATPHHWRKSKSISTHLRRSLRFRRHESGIPDHLETFWHGDQQRLITGKIPSPSPPVSAALYDSDAMRAASPDTARPSGEEISNASSSAQDRQHQDRFRLISAALSDFDVMRAASPRTTTPPCSGEGQWRSAAPRHLAQGKKIQEKESRGFLQLYLHFCVGFGVFVILHCIALHCRIEGSSKRKDGKGKKLL